MLHTVSLQSQLACTYVAHGLLRSLRDSLPRPPHCCVLAAKPASALTEHQSSPAAQSPTATSNPGRLAPLPHRPHRRRHPRLHTATRASKVTRLALCAVMASVALKTRRATASSANAAAAPSASPLSPLFTVRKIFKLQSHSRPMYPPRCRPHRRRCSPTHHPSIAACRRLPTATAPTPHPPPPSTFQGA